MSQEPSKLALPFHSLAPDRNEPLLDDAEKAAIFCLVELERGKGGGIVLKQSVEKIKFIAKIGYPFWLSPFYSNSLVFDGLHTTSHNLSYPPIPNVQEFASGIKRSSSSRQAYESFLSDHINYFHISDQQETAIIEGLVTDHAFVQDFNSQMHEGRPLDAAAPETVLLPPTINEKSILPEIQELEKLRSRFTVEVKDLKESMKLLNATTKDFVKTIRDEIKDVRDRFNAQLEILRSPIELEVKEIRRKGDAETTLVSKRFEKELLGLQKEKVKHEKARDQYSYKIAKCDAEMKTRAVHKDSSGERRWKDEKNSLKKKRSEVESEVKKLEKQIEETEDRKAQELFRIRSEVGARVTEATKELVEIESSRDAKVQLLKQEMGRMEETSAELARQIDKTVNLRETSKSAIEDLGIPQKHGKPTLVYMSFYLACLQNDSRKRYVHYPPSNVNNVKLLVKLKGVLGMARVKDLFSPRSLAIATFLNRFPSLMEENAVFETETSEAAASANMLQKKETVDEIKSGLKKLKEEGWLSEKELESFTQALP